MPEPIVYSSHRLDLLVKQLYTQIDQDRASLFDQPLIIIPHVGMKEWILLECAKVALQKAVVGWEFASWQKGLSCLAGSLPIPTRTELLAALWNKSKKNPREEWVPFLDSERKRLDFVDSCAALFYDYLMYGLPKSGTDSWQAAVFEELFETHSWFGLEEALRTIPIQRAGSVYLFANDWMPPAAYRFYLRHPSIRLFRFSPTAMFWEDLRSTKERKSLLSFGQKNRVSEKQLQVLEEMLRQEQPLLANWGVLGRKMLEIAVQHEVDVIEQYYLAREPSTLLTQLQYELLTMESIEKKPDETIRLLQTGASRWREVEILRDEILRARDRGISFSDMRVYAPDLELYAPLIQCIFSDEVPFRLAGIDLIRQSSYFQALLRLCQAVSGRWEAKNWVALLETKAFYQKQGWQSDELEKIKGWIEQGRIRWGADRAHQDEITSDTIGVQGSGMGTWEEGFDRLIDSWVFFDPERETALNWSEADLFEQFQSLFYRLRTILFSWKKERTLQLWVQEIDQLTQEFLTIEDAAEEDRSAKQQIAQVLSSLRDTHQLVPETVFPFSFVKHLLFAPSCAEFGSSLLHAVRFSTIEPGTLAPAKIVFLIGMDEENFPRSSAKSSLHLLKANGVYHPNKGDWDRYLFLEALFAAEEQLVFSYGHRSREDGKPVSPSLLIQELLGYLQMSNLAETFPASPLDACSQNRCLADYQAAVAARSAKVGSLLTSPLRKKNTPTEKTTLSIRDLKNWLKHPFQYYLKQIVGIELKEEPCSKWEDFECSGLTRYLFLREALEHSPEVALEKMMQERRLPLGLLGEEAKRELLEKAQDVKDQLQVWSIPSQSIQTIEWKESCIEEHQVGPNRLQKPPLEVEIHGQVFALVGEASQAVPNGILHTSDDSIGSVLRSWVEVLAILVSSKTHDIYFTKTGKVRTVEDPRLALQRLIGLYLEGRGSLLFMHSEWADSLLRKREPVDGHCEDRILDWALKRSPSLDLEKEREEWTPILEVAFSGLIDLYPTRKAKSSHADV